MLGVDLSSGIFKTEADPISYNIAYQVLLYLVRTKHIWLLVLISLYFSTAHELAHISPIAQALKTCADDLSPSIPRFKNL